MSNSHRPHFPIPLLTHNADLIITAGLAHTEVAARLPDKYLTDSQTLLVKVSSDISDQRTKKGALGGLTAAQQQTLGVLQHCMNQARNTARLAFPGQTVKLHQQFQIGSHDRNDLGSFLDRADTILAAVKDTNNLAAMKLKGWTDDETTTFDNARQGFGPADEFRQKSIGGAKDATALKDSDAADLYEHLQTIQNAADLEYPATDPANAGVRDEFCLNTFPPGGGNHTPVPPPPAPQTASGSK